jgi:hypothetical protein
VLPLGTRTKPIGVDHLAPVAGDGKVGAPALTLARDNFHGHYSFAPTNLAGERRALRDPDAPDED